VKLDPEKLPLPSGELGKLLSEAGDELRAALVTGKATTCPCCGGDAKVYARALGATMVKVLRALNRAGEHGLVSRDIVAQTLVQSDTGKLAAWGFAHKGADHRWRITPRGRDFLQGGLAVAHRVLFYQGHVIGFDYSRMVRVRDVSKEFDLERDVLSAAAVQNAELR